MERAAIPASEASGVEPARQRGRVLAYADGLTHGLLSNFMDWCLGWVDFWSAQPNPRAKRAGWSPRASAGVPTRVHIEKSPESSVNTGYSGDRLWKFHSGITVPLFFHQKGL